MNIADVDRGYSILAFGNRAANAGSQTKSIVPGGTISVGKGANRKSLNQDSTKREGGIYSTGNPMSGKQKDEQLDGLTMQLRRVQERIAGLQDKEDMTPEQKIEMKKELSKQLAEIQQQIAARQMEMQQAEKEKQEEELKKAIDESMPATQENGNQVFENSEMENLANISKSFDEVNLLNKVRTKMEGDLRVKEIELKIAGGASRGVAVEGKIAGVINVETAISNLEKNISKKIGKILEGVDGVRKESAEELQKPKEDQERLVGQEEATPSDDLSSKETVSESAQGEAALQFEPQQVIPVGTRPLGHVSVEL